MQEASEGFGVFVEHNGLTLPPLPKLSMGLSYLVPYTFLPQFQKTKCNLAVEFGTVLHPSHVHSNCFPRIQTILSFAESTEGEDVGVLFYIDVVSQFSVSFLRLFCL